ncbi:MAG TPA: hypothetical protein VNE41_06530 [Chitinophagaceae bacterium]|nr:hypothetical protein [Chitinophagaceae bacterium]
MRTTKLKLLTGWSFMRLLRLVFGIFFGIQAIQSHDLFLGLIAIFFLFQGVTNTGCCGAGGCQVSPPGQIEDKQEDLSFEEMKMKN